MEAGIGFNALHAVNAVVVNDVGYDGRYARNKDKKGPRAAVP